MLNLVHKELSYTITGVCFSVAKALGRFCKERQYADYFEKELIKRRIPYKREIKLELVNSEAPLGNQADFLVDGLVLVDLKAKRLVTKEDYYQMQRYLKACNLELGLIVNFRNATIKPKRVLNSGYSDVNSSHSDRERGFTLIEMMVAVGIFVVIMMISVGSFLSLLQANYKAQTTKVVVNNLHFALENMTRNLRTGSFYHCDFNQGDRNAPRDCAATPSSSLIFKARDGRMVVYRQNGASIERSVDGGTTFVSITSPDIVVKQLQFYVDGASASDKRQPRVLLLTNGSMKGRGKVVSKFNLETLVTQRVLDI